MILLHINLIGYESQNIHSHTFIWLIIILSMCIFRFAFRVRSFSLSFSLFLILSIYLIEQCLCTFRALFQKQMKLMMLKLSRGE